MLALLIKQVTEAALEAEVDEHLAQKEAANRKHGSSRKTVKTSSGPFQLDTPRDRNGSFAPPKRSKNIKPDSPMKWSEKSSLCLH
ncbi:transposase [Vibrio parahaemolyticus]|nr:transposase [Vibrio parahaemolyticus]